MYIRPTRAILLHGQHHDPSQVYEVAEQDGRHLIATGAAVEVAAPTPPSVIETREPAVTTREPQVRQRPTGGKR